MGEVTSLGTPASSKPGSGQCNDFLTFSGTKFGSDRKTEKFLSVLTGPGCRQVWSCVRKAVLALHADRHPPDPVATFELGILLPRGGFSCFPFFTWNWVLDTSWGLGSSMSPSAKPKYPGDIFFFSPLCWQSSSLWIGVPRISTKVMSFWSLTSDYIISSISSISSAIM